jgi:hypothetical protein
VTSRSRSLRLGIDGDERVVRGGDRGELSTEELSTDEPSTDEPSTDEPSTIVEHSTINLDNFSPQTRFP